jgi:hypothetical protein
MSKQERVDAERSETVDDGSRELERLLGGLVPIRPALDVRRMLAEAARRCDAGARAARRQVWLWRGVATTLAASLALMAWIGRAPPSPGEQIVERIVRMPAPAGPQAIAAGSDALPSDAPSPMMPRAPGSCAYLVLRQQVLARGMDALRDASAPATMTPPTIDDSPFRPLRGEGGGM